ARDYRFNTADWNRVENYVRDDVAEDRAGVDYICLKIDIMAPNGRSEDGYATNIYRINQARQKKYDANPTLKTLLSKDLTMTAMWDIETYQQVQNGEPPKPSDLDYTIFMMCSAYFPHYTSDSYVRVCCQIGDAQPRADVDITVACPDEREMMLADIEIKSRMRFDILGAFNGGCFDWPIFLEKLRRQRLLGYLFDRLSMIPDHYVDGEDTMAPPNARNEERVMRWSFRSEKIKISAELDHEIISAAQIPGWIDTDVLPTFLKLYTRMEVKKLASLNFFLESNKIESKADMPYKRMFRIYERSRKLADCHECHCGDDCDVCEEHVPDLDDEIPLDDRTSCCHCIKRPINLKHMGDVAYYCVIDCVRPQQLFNARVITYDKRELSTMSFVNLYDSFWRADGMKVRNLIGSYCTRYNIAFPAAPTENKRQDEKIHYPGAHVFPPVRGLVDRPLTGLDFASLYPNLMITYNLSPDVLVYDPAEVERLRAEGYSIHQIGPVQCEQGEKKGLPSNTPVTVQAWVVRHNGIVGRNETTTVAGYDRVEATPDGSVVTRQIRNAAILQTDRADVKDLAPSNPEAKFSYKPVPGRQKLPGERMGIFAYVVKKIFEKRVPVKRRRVQLDELIEQMEKDNLKSYEIDGEILSLADIVFLAAKVKSKEGALKVLANTFYGETGNFRSSIYSIHIAAGVTEMGQYNIKSVHAYTLELMNETKYGDTDSLYTVIAWNRLQHSYDWYESELVRIAAKSYTEAEARQRIIEPVRRPKYCVATASSPLPDIIAEVRRRDRLAARLKHWEEIVQITMDVIAVIRNQVNEWLITDNGCNYLTMAYEEVGWPAVLCGKKKYFMTPHIGKINFYNEKPMVKGIDIIKQGKSQLVKDIGMEVILEVLAPENEKSLFDIATGKIARIHGGDWPLEMFKQMARYQPHKQNKPVLRFVGRMQQMHRRYEALAHNAPAEADREEAHRLRALYTPPDAGDKFAYLMVEKEQQWMPTGKKIDMKNGDFMEFIHIYEASQSSADPMKINLNYYVKKSAVGVLARFIVGADEFQPPDAQPHETLTLEEYEALDKYCVKAATKYLSELSDKIVNIDKKATFRSGVEYRRIYRLADALLRADLLARYGWAGFPL
ncbi:MAG: DNA polymerase domain-containing protein, partial [Castellaniella sp.]